MNKKRNTVLLFGISLLILLTLQVIYIYNSYRLQEKDFYREAKEISSKSIAQMERFTESNEELFVQNFLVHKNAHTIDAIEVDSLRKKLISPEKLTLNLEKIIKNETKNTPYKLAIKNEIYSITDNNSKEELLSDPIVFYQTNERVKKGQLIHESKWNSNLTHLYTEKNLNEKYSYIVKSHASFELLNIQMLTIQKILPLCFVSLLIILLLLYIFRKNMKNIEIQDKKIAQLHTTIDSITHELNTPIATLKFLMATKEKNETDEIFDRQIKRLQHIVSSVHSNNIGNDWVSENNIQTLIQKLQKDYPSLTILSCIHFEENIVFTLQNMETILHNLIDNSFKYKAKTVHLDINFSNKITFSVSDDGIGIPTDEHHKIFDKYYRISRNENHEISGLGVGLYLIKRIVDDHKGSVEIFSNPQHGVTFKIVLPNEK